jgi:hypothetical protein
MRAIFTSNIQIGGKVAAARLLHGVRPEAEMVLQAIAGKS